MLNLVGNAVKFTQHGQVMLDVTQAIASDGRARLTFSVHDTGIGIAAAAIDRLFMPFTQADTSTTRRFGGTGLGLSIVRKLVEMMGGNIGANSTEGKGSTFWFELPLPVVAGASAAPAARSGRVLVVDDNEHSRAALSDQLTDAGFAVTLASDGAQALAMIAANQPFEIVLIDQYMPQLDGIALGAELSKTSALLGSQLVLLTSVDHTTDTQCATHGTFFGYLTKPVRTSALLDCIDRALLHLPAREQSAPAEPAAPIRPAQRWAGVRVLVAEDNVVNQRVARRFLERLGCEVDVVDDGAQAVEVLTRSTYDLVLMDMQMPIMDGLEASRRIREQEQAGQRIPIVALTADAMVGTFERCLAAGMDDYLTKPIDVKRLEEVLARFTIQDNPPSAALLG